MSYRNRKSLNKCRLSLCESSAEMFVRRANDDCKPTSRRQAFILVCALACLSVSTAIVICSTREALLFRSQGRKDRQLQQTQWLLDAGIRKAVGKLNTDASYRGESWRPTSAIKNYSHVLVDIEIAAVEGDELRRSVRVTAQLGNVGVPKGMHHQSPRSPSGNETISAAWYEKTQCSHRFDYTVRTDDVTPLNDNEAQTKVEPEPK